MKKYLVRVELHQETQDHPDYMLLQKFMEHAAFQAYVVGVPGVDLETRAYRLPPGVYYTETDAPILTIRARVKAIADKVTESNSVIVADCNRVEWCNLIELAQSHR